MNFTYVGLSKDQSVVKGDIQAKNEQAARAALSAKSIDVISIKQPGGALLNSEVSFGSVSRVELLFFVKHLGIMLKSGISIFEGLNMLKEQAKGKMKSVLTKVVDDVSNGAQLAKALRKHPKAFPELVVELIGSGEVSGTLEGNLEYISEFLYKEIDLRKKVKSALLYPMIVLLAVIGLTMSIGLFVLPQILPLFESLDVDLPLSTRVLLWAANLFRDYGVFILGGLIATVTFTPILLELKFVRPYSHPLYLRLPIVGKIIRQLNLARFFRMFATLMDAGLTIDKALDITEKIIRNNAYKTEIRALKAAVIQGKNLADTIQRNDFLFPAMVNHMMKVAERSGNLSDSLSYLSTFFEEEVDDRLKNLSTIIEPMLLIFIGLVVGGVAFAIIGPIYSLTGQIR